MHSWHAIESKKNSKEFDSTAWLCYFSHLDRHSTLARHDDARSEDAAGPNAEPEDSSMASFALAFDRRKKRKYSDKHTELFLQRQSQLSQSILANGQMV